MVVEFFHQPRINIYLTPRRYSRLQNRFEFGSLLIKIVIVFVSLYLHNYQVVYALFSLVSSFMLVGCYIVMVPAYDRKINLMVTSLPYSLPLGLFSFIFL